MTIRKILLVDDEEGIRTVLSIVLADCGYEVFSASSGEQALHLFKTVLPPIVLTDIKMPGMDGIELLKRIKQECPDTEVIMITGHGDMDLAIQSLKFDATDFISKPINEDALEIALKRAWERIEFRATLKRYTENLEQLVEEKTRQLVQAERLAAVGQTVAGLAHGIKNITGGLTGGAFVLEKGLELGNDTYLAQGWSMLKGNVERIKRMALDLLNYTKDREPDYRVCDPNEPLKDVAVLMEPRAEAHGVSLVVEADRDLTPCVFDRDQIHRCIMDLAINALDACTDINCTRAQRKIVLRSSKVNGWAVEYRVIDTGCGMSEEIKGKVFRSFFSTKGSGGTGLGLMITRKIIDEHGGTIDMETSEGKGTTFVIRLPERSLPSPSPGGQCPAPAP